MFERPFWKERVRALLERRSVLWIAGARRSGKTVLCRQLEKARYHDCELPRVRRALEDPELFFRKNGPGLVVLDEIHRLANPSEVLKIAADHFPRTRLVATGSSTLAAQRKFRDTLTGRKSTLWLQPAILEDLRAFGIAKLEDRMLKGGLPPFLLGDGVDDDVYREWIDSFWAKDVQELFEVRQRAAFFKFMELVFRQSGGLFEATALATPCEVSRQTIMSYLEILETTLMAVTLRPFSGGSAAEIKAQRKVYAFDTGFVCYFRDWATLRDDDRGPLLEHLVLGELLAHLPRERLFHWRDKQKHEVDFIVKSGRGRSVAALECKASSSHLDPAGLLAFRRRYPRGRNIVVCLDLAEPIDVSVRGLAVRLVPFDVLDEECRKLAAGKTRSCVHHDS
jgi:predicted AAA+ superfamily ATPase